MRAFVDECQRIVGRVALGELSPSDSRLNALLKPVPPTSLGAEALVLKDVVVKVERGRQAATMGRRLPGRAIRPEIASSDVNLRLLSAALEKIESDYSDPALCAAALARHVGVSQWHLGRHLVRATGHGVRWHINEARVQASRKLLDSTQLSIKEIAAQVGYKSSSELGRHFRQSVGVTPSELRRRQKR